MEVLPAYSGMGKSVNDAQTTIVTAILTIPANLVQRIMYCMNLSTKASSAFNVNRNLLHPAA